MSKRSELPQSRRHVLIYDEDWDWLEASYGRYSPSKLGAGVAIRKLVHRAVVQLRQLAQDTVDSRTQAPTQSELETTDA